MSDQNESTVTNTGSTEQKTCFFCGAKPAVEEAKLEKEIYKLVDRNILRRKVTFQKMKITIPRCKECDSIHSSGSGRAVLMFLIGMVAGGLAGWFAPGQHWIAGALVCAALGWMIGQPMGHKLVQKSGIKDESDATLATYPPAAELVKEGWTFKQPRAY